MFLSCFNACNAAIKTLTVAKGNLMSIKQRRLAKGWSQEDLARHSGLSTRTIQRIESGQSAGSESLKCLAAVFETSINSLIQEQKMNLSKQTENSPKVKLSKIEKEAIKFAQSILKEPKQGQADPLTKIERNAINYGKDLLSKLKS